jgi:glucose 1-dehydrogenase
MDKVVLVTGAARGIGLGIARGLAQAGASVVMADLLSDEVLEASRHVPGASAIACDIRSPDENARAVRMAVEHFGRIDAFVACAAASRRGAFLDVTPEDLRFTLDTSLAGTFYGCQAAARQLVKQETGGGILIISSVHVIRHYPRASAYNMAKAGVHSLAKTMAAELAPYRIRVNTIQPGWTYTPGELAFATEEQLQTAGARIPAGRLGRPADIANAAIYVLSDAAEYVTGSDLVVDGGHTLSPL